MKDRIIKFRAWDTKEKKFLTKIQVEAVHDSISWGKEYFLEVKEDIEKYDPTRYIFCQSTGLKDRKGKEIYEGDICSYFTDTILEVTWKESSSAWGTRQIKGSFEGDPLIFQPAGIKSEFEVIGNIYENKDIWNDEQKIVPQVER